jgi:hypothetical protein
VEGAALCLTPGDNNRSRIRKIRKAVANGYTFRRIDALDHLDDILSINCSSAHRQGKPIAPHYLDEAAVRKVAEQNPLSFGIFDRNGRLVAYAHTPIFGEVVVFSRILGHCSDLKCGVMYLLVHETLMHMRQRYLGDGHPRWAFYDMYLGARPGLRQFKDEAGFRPYRVVWEWVALRSHYGLVWLGLLIVSRYLAGIRGAEDGAGATSTHFKALSRPSECCAPSVDKRA